MSAQFMPQTSQILREAAAENSPSTRRDNETVDRRSRRDDLAAGHSRPDGLQQDLLFHTNQARHDLRIFRLFEEDLNKRLAKEQRRRSTSISRCRWCSFRSRRDDLLQALAAGKGDIAASNLTITAERQKLVDFSSPAYPNVSEVVVSGPASPAVSSVDDLAGKEVFVRKSSSYYESLVALNQRFAAEKGPPVIIKEAPETLEDEDLIEMVNAGLIPLIVVDKHKADFWKQVFPKITVHDGVAVRTGGDIAWAIRKGSPQLKAAVDDFVARHAQRDHGGQYDPGALPEERKVREGRGLRVRAQEIPRPGSVFPEVRRQVRRGLVADGGPGLPGIPAQSGRPQQGRRHRRDAGHARHRQGARRGRHHQSRAEHPRRRQVHALDDRPVLRQRAHDRSWTRPCSRSLPTMPARAGLSQLRQAAAKRGLDPNVWFDNVEYVAAEKIGAETVTYVSNIYKYYIAYHLIMEAQAERAKAVEKIKGESK